MHGPYKDDDIIQCTMKRNFTYNEEGIYNIEERIKSHLFTMVSKADCKVDPHVWH